MKLLFASDSFKGTITSGQSAQMLERAAREVFGEVSCASLPMADGGEGTTDAVIAAVGGEKVTLDVHGPLMEMAHSYYGKLDTSRAVMEMAQASGLPMVPDNLRNPLNTTTYGTGEMMLDAVHRGFTDISIAIGGSATNDGGMGAMRALGVRFLDKDGGELQGTGADLERVRDIDVSGLDSAIKNAAITVMCDVTNPLCGPNGATRTFGAQKCSASEQSPSEILDRLESGMQNYREVIKHSLGKEADGIPGSGAAGGLGAALMVFLGGKLKNGIETVLDLTAFDEHLKGVDLVVTGEGRTDWQSCFGKVVQGVGDRCKRHGVPAVALVGSMGRGAEDIFAHGIMSMMSTVTDTMTLPQALERSQTDYYDAAVRMFRMIKVGLGIVRR